LGIEQPPQATQIEETNSIYKEQSKTVNLSSRTTAQLNNQPTMGIATSAAAAANDNSLSTIEKTIYSLIAMVIRQSK
jgi:hypothetical protein